MTILINIITLILLVGLYILPTILAVHKEHTNTTSLMIINLLLGWTGIFWVLSLAWVFYKSEAPKTAKKTTKAKAEEKAKTKKIGTIIVVALLSLFVLLLTVNLIGGNTSPFLSNMTAPQLNDPGLSQPGTPMSAEDFLSGQ